MSTRHSRSHRCDECEDAGSVNPIIIALALLQAVLLSATIGLALWGFRTHEVAPFLWATLSLLAVLVTAFLQRKIFRR